MIIVWFGGIAAIAIVIEQTFPFFHCFVLERRLQKVDLSIHLPALQTKIVC